MSREKDKFIGEKKVKTIKPTGETTPSGFEVMEVEYEFGVVEHFSKLMLDKILSDEKCDLSILREKRIEPLVKVVLTILADWGVKMSELPYFSAVLNQSLDFNHKHALSEILGKWIPKPKDPEEVDMITINRILHSIDAKIQDN